MPKIPSHYVRASLSGVRARGEDVKPLLINAGVPLAAYYGRNDGIDNAQYIALVQQIWKHLNDEFFGLTSQRCKPGLFAIFARMTSHHSTLHSVFQEWVNLYNVTREDISLTLAINPHSNADTNVPLYFVHAPTLNNRETAVCFRLTAPELDNEHFFSEFLLLTLHRFSSWLTGKSLPLKRLTLAYPKPAHHFLYNALFDCEILFDQPHTGFVFDTSCLDLPLIRNQREITRLLKTAPAEFMQLPSDDNSFTSRTKILILDHFRHAKRFPSFDQTAEHLTVSQRTLRRKLKAEGASYQEIKDLIRKDIAIDKLKRENISLDDIAKTLGFSELNAFSRAFKRWTSTSPGRYRERELAMGINGLPKAASLSTFY